MEAFGIYLLKSAVWLTGFTLIYFIFLRNERFFSLNRAFLLAGIFASVVFPFFTWHYAVILPSLPTEEISTWEFSNQDLIAAPEIIPASPIPFYWWLYILGIACLMLRLTYQTFKLLIRLSKTGYEKNGPVKLVRTPEYTASFSFFSFVFVNPSTSDLETKEILNHESGHIQSRHWFDLLLMELLRILQWFNPFVWIYAHLVRQNHEYLADQLALRQTADPAIYRAALLNQVLGVPVISLANSFSYSLNQKRFAMMKKRIQSPIRKLKLLMVLPLMMAVFYAFAKPEYIEASPTATENVSDASKEGKVKGTITNEKGDPLESVTIAIKGTTIGTISDANGDYILKDVPSDAELVFSFVGMKSKTLKADFDHRMKVQMEISTIAIEPVNVGANPNKYNSSNSLSSEKLPEAPKGKDQFYAIEQMPQFPGGSQAMMRYLVENVKYPVQAREAGKEGTVLVNFQVNPRGKIRNAAIRETVDPALDAEALRVINGMPDWIPGKQNGKAVEVAYSIPVQFSLKHKSEDNNQLIDPLFILDGVALTKQEFEKIKLDPSEIESISVLKDKSATSVFGEKGANGVILITSKKNSNPTGKASSDKTVVGHSTFPDAQVVGYGKQKEEHVFLYNEIDVKPKFPGGERVMYNFLRGNVKYPVIASEEGITGTVLVRFIISKSGKIETVGVVNEVNGSLKAEAVRVIKRMPEWDPGKSKGEPVDVACTMCMKFSLSGQKSDDQAENLKGDFGPIIVVGFGQQGSNNPPSQPSIQNQDIPLIDGEEAFIQVEQMPEFPGGKKELMKFIQDNLKYPSEAAAQGIQGTVVIQFVVTKNGKPDHFKIIRGVNTLLDNEALRVIKSSPDWIPGQQGGKPVNVYYTLPFRFVLSGKNENAKIADKDSTFVNVEQLPEFPGGKQELMKFISANTKYPDAAKKLGIQGNVIVQFVVTKLGKIENIKVVRGVGSGCDEEAIRVLKLSPDWIPGKQGGKPVNVMFTLPFVFRLG